MRRSHAPVGNKVGLVVGDKLGGDVGAVVGLNVGAIVGGKVLAVGASVGAVVFLSISSCNFFRAIHSGSWWLSLALQMRNPVPACCYRYRYSGGAGKEGGLEVLGELF